MMYLGDFRISKVVRFMWNTNAVAGESITRATNGTISVYKDGNTTQSTTGVTDTEDFDSLTGVHYCAIDTSSDGTFYSAGSEFAVVLSGATIDGKSINAVLAHFSLEARSALMPTTDGRKLDVSTGGEAGLDWANIGAPTTTVNLSGTSTKALEPTTAGRTLDVTSTGEAGIDWSNIGSPTTVVGLSGTTIKDVTDVNTDTDTILSRIGTPSDLGSGATLAANHSDMAHDGVGTGGNYDRTTDSLEALSNRLPTSLGANGNIKADVRDYNGTAGTFSGGRPEVNTTHAAGTAWNSGAITASTLAADSITAAKIADGAIDAATFATGAITAAAIAADAIGASELAADAVAEIQSGLSTLTAAGIRSAIGLASANLDTQLDALPTAAEIADAVFDEDYSGHTTAGTYGKLLGSETPGVDDWIYDNVVGLYNRLPTSLDSGNMRCAVQAYSLSGSNAEYAIVNSVLVANRLDELLVNDASFGAQNPTTGSVFHQLMSKTAGSFTYDRTTDSLEGIRDNFPSNFSSLGINASGHISRVTLVDTTTTVTNAVTVTGDAATAGTRFLTMIELDGSVYRYTTNALEMGPGGSGDDPLDNLVPGSYPSGTAGYALGRLGSGTINVVSPISQRGDIEIVQGDAYITSLGRALSWTDQDAQWPDLTDSTISLEIGDGTTNTIGEIVTATGASKSVRVQLSSSTTNNLEAGTYDYNLVATFPGTGTVDDRVTLATGTVTVVDREDG